MITKFNNFINENYSINEEVDDIDVDSIVPLKKDIERADGLQFQGKTFYGNGSPFGGEASKMAKLIKDKVKLVRRAKAVVDRWGTRNHYGLSRGEEQEQNIWGPFKVALKSAGFTDNEIYKISQYRSDD